MAIKRADVTPVYVNDQDEALEFFVGRLGMEKVWKQCSPPSAFRVT